MAKKRKEKKQLTDLEKWFRFLRRFYACFLKFIFPVKKYGHVEPYTGRSYIIVGNHYSCADVIPAALATDMPVRYMAKSELFKGGIVKRICEKTGAIPVSRDGNDVRAVMQALKCLKNGEIVVIFPEGTRNKTNEIFLPFKSGAAALAIKTQSPVIPMVQVKKMRVFKKARVLYGEPIEFTEFYGKKLSEEEIKECDETLRLKMLEMYAELKQMLDKKSKKKKKAAECASGEKN